MTYLHDHAQLHRPRDRDTMRCAAVELRERGLTPRDIAGALQISESAVRQLLFETAWTGALWDRACDEAEKLGALRIEGEHAISNATVRSAAQALGRATLSFRTGASLPRTRQT